MAFRFVRPLKPMRRPSEKTLELSVLHRQDAAPRFVNTDCVHSLIKLPWAASVAKNLALPSRRRDPTRRRR
jgi:hypothetical protein